MSGETARRRGVWKPILAGWLLVCIISLSIRAEEKINTENASATKRVCLFSGRSCGSCEAIEAWLKKNSIPYLAINIDEIDGYKQLVVEEERLGREVEKLPALIYGDTLIGGREQIIDTLPKVKAWFFDQPIEQNDATSISMSNAPNATSHPDAVIESRFQSLSVLTVALAGLADGINPCAFATIAFLVGCLLGSGGEKQRALRVGLSFAGGVFLTYLAVGFGAFKALFAVREFQAVRQVFHLVTLTLLVLAVLLMLVDAIHAWRKHGEVLFRMPTFLRERTNLTIAKGLHTSRWIAGGFVLGVVVSLLELACTGQVYLPTILYVLETPELAARAVSFLVLYNLMFIVPLLVVLGLSLRGMQAQTLWAILKKHAALSRVICAGVFGLMFWAVWR